MIIQTGMRTDIPAFYSEWLCNRIKEGYVMVRNPYQPQQVTRYTFSPSVVDLIAFCSKNPAPMLSHMDLLKTYGNVLVRYHYPLWKRNRASGSRCRNGNRYISATG